jgi:DNA-binding LacI/PurR family transcriptional regulator
MHVPRESSIVRFDDLPIATFIEPQLTTVRVPAAEMGRLAAEAVIEHFRKNVPLRSIVLPTELSSEPR